LDKEKLLRISLAQINPTIGDFDGNIIKIANFINRAKRAGADIVAFPELALCGYPPEDLLLRPSFPKDTAAALERILPSTNGICAIIGFAEPDNGSVYNSAAVIVDGRIAATYRKIELPNYGVFDEKRHFKSGASTLIFELSGVRVAMTVCEDIWIAGGRAEQGIIAGAADVAINISASPFHAGKMLVREDLIKGLAKRTGAFVCYTNLLGGQDEIVFDGGGIIARPDGKLLATSPRFEEFLLTVELEIPTGRAKQAAESQDYVSKAISVTAPRAEHINACPPPAIARELSEVEETYSALVLGTGDYVRKNRFEKVLIGLSGGIDSALTAAIAVDALGEENVIGVTMPSEYTSGDTLSDAELLAENLKTKLITVPISDILSSYMELLAEPFGPGEPGIEKENLQARIRGNILMALSNRFGWIVLTTGNKSETAVGYCTLYGDMAGGFAVIKDVPKTIVYKLSDYVNTKEGREIIPQSTIDRPPTAELRPDQKDEDSLPPYPVLDPIIHLYVEEDKSPYEIIAAGFDPAVVHEVVRMIDRSEYKRRQAPPGVKITPKAFGRDRRLPITNRYRYKL
jgi:NAD+ synthase (glutamine-hydrolysing)